MKKKLICAFLALTLIFVGTACGSNKGGDAAYVEGVTVSKGVMTYFFKDVFNTFIGYYESSLDKLGIEPTKPLRTQMRSDGMSWHEYFSLATKNWVERIVVLNKAALEEGITLTDAEKAALQNRMKTIDVKLYGMNNDEIYEAKCMEALAYKYQTIKKAEFAPTDTELQTELAENFKSYSYVDYLAFPLTYAGDNAEFTKAEAGTLAAELAAVKTADEYRDIVTKILLAKGYDVSDVNYRLEHLEYTGRTYSESSAAMKWAFGAKTGDTFISEGTSGTMYTVYMLTEAPYTKEEPTINIRYIILDNNAFGGAASTEAMAASVIEKFNSGDKSAESFAALALEYSSDSASYYLGGAYSNLTDGSIEGTMNAWCFSDTRKPGDITAIKTSAGMNIILFEGEGPGTAHAAASDAVANSRFDEHLSKLAEKYPVTFNDEVVAEIGE